MSEKLTLIKSDIREVLSQHGPMRGKDVVKHLSKYHPILIWKASHDSPDFRLVNCARYYLRYDNSRHNHIRLSPSILRNFLSFTLLYLVDQNVDAMQQSILLANHHRQISLQKLGYAREAIMSLDDDILEALHLHCCAFIAGDVAYFLAHEETRMNQQFDVPIKGSDIDLIFVHTPNLAPDIIKRAEKQMLATKFRFLKDPEIAQELDFIFKPVSKVVTQMQYQNIRQKIACKILYESFFLFGDLQLFNSLQNHLKISGTSALIEADFKAALSQRQETYEKIWSYSEEALLNPEPELRSLFYFSQERLEFD